jgi:hypothetical protein
MRSAYKRFRIRPGPQRHRWPAKAAALFLALQGIHAFASGAPPAQKLVNIADTRGLSPGITKWIADIYNTSYWSYGFLVVAVLNLGRMQHHE